jgi:stage III sporulation protein AG
MDIKKDFNRIFKNFLNKSGKEKITIIILTGILLLVISLPTGSKKSTTEDSKKTSETATQSEENVYSSYCEYLEKKLEDALKNVDGVGDVNVVITLKNTSQKVLATDSEISDSSVNETDSSGGARSTTQHDSTSTNIYYDTDDGSSPYVVMENMPEVEGVVITAKGGADGTVCCEITEAAEALLGVPVHKIKVLKMN